VNVKEGRKEGRNLLSGPSRRQSQHLRFERGHIKKEGRKEDRKEEKEGILERKGRKEY
jgi:hypothetical protein